MLGQKTDSDLALWEVFFDKEILERSIGVDSRERERWRSIWAEEIADGEAQGRKKAEVFRGQRQHAWLECVSWCLHESVQRWGEC